jgi:hypothetical protein
MKYTKNQSVAALQLGKNRHNPFTRAFFPQAGSNVIICIILFSLFSGVVEYIDEFGRTAPLQ